MKSHGFVQGVGLGRWLLLAAVLTLPVRGSAQTSTGTIRGYVKDANGNPVSGAEVQAKNVATGVMRSATSRPDGAYVLPGLTPEAYELVARAIGHSPQGRRVVVAVGATLIVDFTLTAGAVELAAVTVSGPAAETRTSEVATNVSQVQIQALPTASRNFLDLAALAPGITITEDRADFTNRTFTAGGQTASSTNIFVDGTSLKNDLTAQGVVGQDASRGNPFPRSAIQEYRVISQNFKAEYQKSSSAIITAVTRSGGNTWSGNALFTYQNRDLVALDTFQRATSGFTKPDYTRTLLGLSGGGPIMKDRLFFFGSYEGNYQNRSNLVNVSQGLPTAGAFPALDSVNLAQYNGNFTSPFRETMLFGKLNYAIGPHASADVSFSNRHETDVRDFGNNNAFSTAVNFRQDISIAQARYNRFSGPWLNEAKIDYSRFRRNPEPNAPGLPQRTYQFGPGDHNIGSNLSIQDFIQKRLGFRDDLTYTGFQRGGDHVIKAGASVDFVTYDVFKGNDVTPRFFYRDTLIRNTDTLGFDFRNPYQLVYGTGDPSLNKTNQQVGAYIQDDWSPTRRLTFNVGIRWDFESKMMNYDYVTPQNVIDTLTRYRDSLPTKLDLSRFISDGTTRKPFYGAFQPRLGFSYALDDNNVTTIFGGWGIYYDRTLFDVSVDETLKLSHPTYTIQFADPDSTPKAGEVQWDDRYLTANQATLDSLVGVFGTPEAWLIDSKAKVPRSRQWNLGVRRVLGAYTVTATLSGVRGENQLALNWAQFALNPNGSCCVSFNIGAHGFSNFIYSTNDVKTWYDALQLQVDRPYQRTSEDFGWGGGVAVTYATRSVQGADNLGDLFDFPNTLNIPRHPANDEKVHIVANWVTDVPYMDGFQFSGLITLGSGNRLDVGCPIRFCGGAYERGGFTPDRYGFIVPNAFAYRRVDLRLRKDFPNISGTTLGLTVDLFNAFNHQNFGCYNTNPKPNIDFGKAGCVVSDPRRLQIGAEYSF